MMYDNWTEEERNRELKKQAKEIAKENKGSLRERIKNTKFKLFRKQEALIIATVSLALFAAITNCAQKEIPLTTAELGINQGKIITVSDNLYNASDGTVWNTFEDYIEYKQKDEHKVVAYNYMTGEGKNIPEDFIVPADYNDFSKALDEYRKKEMLMNKTLIAILYENGAIYFFDKNVSRAYWINIDSYKEFYGFDEDININYDELYLAGMSKEDVANIFVDKSGVHWVNEEMCNKAKEGKEDKKVFRSTDGNFYYESNVPRNGNDVEVEIEPLTHFYNLNEQSTSSHTK